MTTRINSAYAYGSWSWDRDYQRALREEREARLNNQNISIWGDNYFSGSNNSSMDDYPMLDEDPMSGPIPGVTGLNYIEPGAPYAPMEGIMTAPFGANDNLFSSGIQNYNPFVSAGISSTSIFANQMNGNDNNSFLSLTSSRFDNNNNIFSNTTVNADNFDSLRYSNTNIKTGGDFGGLTSRSTNIHTPSVDFNSREFNNGNNSFSKTNISGDINSYRQTNSHISSPTADLNRTSQVIDTPTETITRTRTRGTLWV
jgi:hypothetical protein